MKLLTWDLYSNVNFNLSTNTHTLAEVGQDVAGYGSMLLVPQPLCKGQYQKCQNNVFSGLFLIVDNTITIHGTSHIANYWHTMVHVNQCFVLIITLPNHYWRSKVNKSFSIYVHTIPIKYLHFHSNIFHHHLMPSLVSWNSLIIQILSIIWFISPQDCIQFFIQ